MVTAPFGEKITIGLYGKDDQNGLLRKCEGICFGNREYLDLVFDNCSFFALKLPFCLFWGSEKHGEKGLTIILLGDFLAFFNCSYGSVTISHVLDPLLLLRMLRYFWKILKFLFRFEKYEKKDMFFAETGNGSFKGYILRCYTIYGKT
jgi:hypothetical protein